MAQFTWTFDAPSGSYKNHAISSRLYESALEESIFMDFVRPVEGFGRKMGETVTLMRVAELTEPASAVLTEGIRIPEDEMAMSQTSITVQELGRALPYTNLAEELGKFDVESPVQKRLKNQLRNVMDTIAAAAFKLAKVKYIPTGLASSTIDTNGTPSAQATQPMNVFHLEEIRDYMYDTLRCPAYQGDDFIGAFRTKSIRGVKRDPAWEEWHKYTDPQSKFNSEVGRIEQIRLIETNHANALANKGAGSVLGEGVVFGDDAVAMAETMTPELRAAIPGDFGRSKAVAWYGILATGIIFDTANAGEARIIHVTST